MGLFLAGAALAAHVKGERSNRAADPSPLSGRVFDGDGQPLIATHSRKNGQRYRYYVSRALHLSTARDGLRLAAPELERLVVEELSKLLADPLALIDRAKLAVAAGTIDGVLGKAAVLAAELKHGQCVPPAFVERVVVGGEAIVLQLGAATRLLLA